MRIMLVKIFIVTISSICSAQSAIELPKYYNGKGIIFGDSVKTTFDISDKDYFSKPTEQEIGLVEELLISNIKSSDKGLVKKLKKCNRQYVGYINKRGEKVVLVILLNFTNKRKAERYFENWEKEVVIGFGSFYESHLFTYKVNLGAKNVTVF